VKAIAILLIVALLVSAPAVVQGQQNVLINMAPIDGIAITAGNILGYQVQSSGPGNVQVKGTIRYKNSDVNLSYSFNTSLRQGMNSFNLNFVHPTWTFSSAALRELFLTYNVLPGGTFEYCVEITPVNALKESSGNSFSECMYHRADDFFVINLIDPENKAKLHEFNPMLSWIANYSFSNQLTYRLRVAEIKQGQDAVNAVMRNQPMFDDRNLMQNSMVYPVYAKPLEANKPYAWTVDAYYKGILLGGSETWQFIIPTDTVPSKIPVTRSYIDVRLENGTSRYYIAGELKIKYVLDKLRKDVLTLELQNESKEAVSLTPKTLDAVYGDNRYVINLKDGSNLKHMNNYTLIVTTKSGEKFALPFKYINPDLAQ